MCVHTQTQHTLSLSHTVSGTNPPEQGTWEIEREAAERLKETLLEVLASPKACLRAPYKCQKRPTTGSQETYYRFTRDLLKVQRDLLCADF
jgi:hypothetical protein